MTTSMQKTVNGRLQDTHEEEESCLDLIQDAVADQPGIVQVQVDTRQEKFSLAYDPQQVSESDINQVMHDVGPILRQRWDSCVMRLGKQGGRACESCALALENRLRQVDGVQRATASYMGGALTVYYDQKIISPDQIRQRVRALGAPLVTEAAAEVAAIPPDIFSRLRAWLGTDQAEIIFTIITFIGMAVGFITRRLDVALVPTVAYAVAYVTGGYYGLVAGLQSLRHRTIDVDLLMVLAALGAALVNAPFEGVMLLFLFSLSNVLQSLAMDRTRSAIRSLMKLRPNEALVRRGGRTMELPIEQIFVGDLMIVRPGDRIPLDGEIVEGTSSLDQSAITGESIPVRKEVGDTVLAGSINQQGGLEVRVTRLAQDSTIARLIKLVEEAQSEKAKTQRFIDTAEQYYALGVIIMTALAIAIPVLILGQSFSSAFYRAMTLMVAASPCALVISTPATVLSAIGNGARRGVLFKGGAYVEQAATIQVIAFDKTGTLTVGRPAMTDVIRLPDARESEAELLRLAAAVEAKSEHPLAQAITQAAQQRNLALPEVKDFQSETGLGVRAQVDGERIAVGNQRYFAAFDVENGAEVEGVMAALHDAGKTAVIIARMKDGKAHLLGVIGIADILRPDAAAVVRQLKALGVAHIVMLTGDNPRVAQAIAREVGLDEVHAGLMPEDKMNIIKELGQKYGPVAMVGDGVNDAPALALAEIGIAMGAAGTDVALESAEVVLMADDLNNIPYVIALSRQTRKTLLQNLTFAIGMILVLILSVLGFNLALPLSVVGHEGSTVLVSLNGLRMLGYRYQPKPTDQAVAE
ncbi:MAG: cadmium-translocating P-type ATPase [Anaerolineales bacterium]|nr:cadmium-translocating P-type ATPase [Anaerolineales bacterium]